MFSAYHKAGLSTIPIRADGSKAPAIGAWSRYQNRMPEIDTVERWIEQHQGVAIIAGAASGNLEVIDIDDPKMCRPFFELVRSVDAELYAKLCLVRTPSDGAHVYYRLESIPGGNQKLALSDKKEALIETRGHGGYVLAPGCSKDCHPLGKTYDHVGGPTLEDLSVISDEEHKILFESAKSFSRVPTGERCADEVIAINTDVSKRPGDDYNRTESWESLLVPHGWRKIHERGGFKYWCRPGKERGVSATTGCTSRAGVDLLYVFSTNAPPFTGGGSCHSKFDAYCLLHYEGNYRRGAAALRSLGHGTDDSQPREVHTKTIAPPPDPLQKSCTLREKAHDKLELIIDGQEQLVSFGIPEFDNALDGGVYEGEVIVLAAKSGHGKTATALQVCYNWSELGKNCLIVSEEMSALMLGKRAIQFSTPVPYHEWADNSDKVKSDIEEHFRGKGEIYVVEHSVTVDRAIESIEQHIEDHGVKFIAVDYVQSFQGMPGQSRVDVVSRVSQQLLKVARRRQVTILILAQMNREIDGRKDWQPRNSDLKDSSQIEHDADIIVFQVYPWRVTPAAPRDDMLFYITKARNHELQSPAFKCTFRGDRQMLLYHVIKNENNFSESRVRGVV